MHKSKKQVLLKYNTVERRRGEDDALMFRLQTLLRWFFLAALIFFPFMFYIPYYLEYRRGGDTVIYGWGLNTSRSIPLYVFPENDTSLIISSHICSEPLTLLVIVCSAVNNAFVRAAIRETWGNFSIPSYKVAFLLGATTNITMQEAIEEEANIHNDIIQENFIDSYNNLTLKSVMLLKFVKNHCDKVKYIFKSDDDMFIHIPNLLALIDVVEKKKFKKMLIGKLICGARPILQTKSKWYTPRYMYQEKTYPHYLSGTGYLMSRDTVVHLYNAALEIPYLHLEDVFITGLCARKANIKPRLHSGFSYGTRPLDPCLYIKNENIITSHRVTTDNLRQLWIGLNNGTICPGKVFRARLYLLKSSSKKNLCS